MSKKSSRRLVVKPALIHQESNFLNRVKPTTAFSLVALILILILVVFYKPYVIDRLEPAGGDRIASIAQSKQILDWQKQTGERALWNPAIFCGVPIYYAVGSNSFHLDVLISKLQFIDWRFWWLIVGAAGCLWLFWELGFPWYFGLIGTIAILFYPHLQALLNVGHFAKFRAVMALPLTIAAFLALAKRANLLQMLTYALAFALLLRTQHYQITFYGLLLMLALGIGFLIDWVKERNFHHLGKVVGLFVISLGLAVAMSALPLFVANEYTPYSTRGGQEVKLDAKETTATKSGGVSFEYATRWSLSPRELMTLIVPRFFGGTSEEIYDGKAYPQLVGQRVPGYWGDMPFTQSSEYMGIVVVILALCGFWYYRRLRLVQMLALLWVLALLLGFGSHFPILYKALFYYLPYFSKFRVPSMILILVDMIMVILALYGLKGLIERGKEEWRPVAVISSFFLALTLFFVLFPQILSYTSPQDEVYRNNPQVLQLLRTIRQEFLVRDTLRTLLLAGLFGALFLAYRLAKITKEIVILGVFLLISFDLIGVSARFLRAEEFVDTQNLERRYFRETRFDRVLFEENENKFRLLALGSQFQSNDLAYRYELVNGYSPIKPQLIQDIIDNNLFNLPDGRQLNWNVVNMLNAKYIIAPGRLDAENLTILDVDTVRRQVLYLNEAALPRAYYVKTVKTLADEREVVAYLNRPDFDPATTALVSKPLPDSIRTFAQNGEVTITQYTPNRVELIAESEETAFLVLADAYYPVGWKATVNGRVTPIYQVNHVLRGIIVPAGEQRVTFVFQPESYHLARTICNISTGVVWLGLLGVVALRLRPACPLRKWARKRT